MMMIDRENLQIYMGSETPLSLVLHTYTGIHAQSHRSLFWLRWWKGKSRGDVHTEHGSFQNLRRKASSLHLCSFRFSAIYAVSTNQWCLHVLYFFWHNGWLLFGITVVIIETRLRCSTTIILLMFFIVTVGRFWHFWHMAGLLSPGRVTE
jgi:hypothetical protein